MTIEVTFSQLMRREGKKLVSSFMYYEEYLYLCGLDCDKCVQEAANNSWVNS